MTFVFLFTSRRKVVLLTLLMKCFEWSRCIAWSSGRFPLQNSAERCLQRGGVCAALSRGLLWRSGWAAVPAGGQHSGCRKCSDFLASGSLPPPLREQISFFPLKQQLLDRYFNYMHLFCSWLDLARAIRGMACSSNWFGTAPAFWTAFKHRLFKVNFYYL